MEGVFLLIHAHIERYCSSGVGQSKAIKKPVEPIRGYAECCGKSLLGHFAIERAFPSGIVSKAALDLYFVRRERKQPKLDWAIDRCRPIISDDVEAPPVVLQQTAQISRSEEHTSELQSLMRISYAVFCLKKKNNTSPIITTYHKEGHYTTYISQQYHQINTMK